MHGISNQHHVSFCILQGGERRNQRYQQRWLDKIIYKTEMKFWAVLGSRGCREKKLPTAISMQLFEVVFSTFCLQTKDLKKSFANKKLKRSSKKVAYLWQLGFFFLSLQPRLPKTAQNFISVLQILLSNDLWHCI